MLVLTDKQKEAISEGCTECKSQTLRFIVTRTDVVIVEERDIIDVHEGEDGTITSIECDDCHTTLWSQ